MAPAQAGPDSKYDSVVEGIEKITATAFATGRLTCMVFEAAGIMPLVDVRAWAGKLPGIDWPGIEPFADARKSTGAADNLRQHLAAVATAHARKLKDGTTAYDKDSLARIDPRPRT